MPGWTGRTSTLVPLSLYFKDGRAKVELALARGESKVDRRDVIAKRTPRRRPAGPWLGPPPALNPACAVSGPLAGRRHFEALT